MLESELFGHIRGSFTDAYRDRVGLLEMADGEAIVLDEIAEMTLRMQALLLRFLENEEIQRVGADQVETRVDVRVIAATNRKPLDRIASKSAKTSTIASTSSTSRFRRSAPAVRIFPSFWTTSFAPTRRTAPSRPRSNRKCSSGSSRMTGPATCAS